MRELVETKSRWDVTVGGQESIADLQAAVRDSSVHSPCQAGLRSICWKSFLLFNNFDPSKWYKPLSDSRSAYTSLKEHFFKDIEHPDDTLADDPLTESETSPWNTLRLDEELRAEIWQDVERCMPEHAFFREPSTQTMLLDILFVYCKLNRDVGYRQGMHEVLAPLLWVVSCDAIDPASKQSESGDLEEVMLCSLDHTYVEHDAFTLFGSVMRNVKTFYETGSAPESVMNSSLSNSPIVERSKRIHEYYLQQTDPELAEHLTAIEILPQIFLIRWVRLLFGREFSFEDVLSLWDMLFAEDPGLDLVDLVAVSMLLRIRWQLLEADYTGALTLLLRYPGPPAPHKAPTFVLDALYLRDNLTLDGGDHIITKYSSRAPETTVTRKLPKKIKRARTAEQAAAQRAAVMSQAMAVSPHRKGREQRGIDEIIQNTAKGLYIQGEKWGVGRALRGAVHGLQNGPTGSRMLSDKPRWSLDAGKHVNSDTSDALVAKIEALERRNKSLAGLLENAMSELWSEQKARQDTSNSDHGLGLAIAKVQFVQVHLENPSMPLPTDGIDDEKHPRQSEPPADEASLLSKTTSPEKYPAIPNLDGTTNPLSEPHTASPSLTKTSHINMTPSTPPTKPSMTATHLANSKSTIPSPAPAISRPALAESPYSWMLGEEKKSKSGFVSTSPLASSDRKPAAGTGGGTVSRSRSLFGGGDEDDREEDVRERERERERRRGRERVSGRLRGAHADDVFTK